MHLFEFLTCGLFSKEVVVVVIVW